MDLRLRTRPTTAQAERAIVVEAAGELDLHSAPQLRAELGRAIEGSAAPRIVADLSGVTFIDSTGVGVLVGALKKAREAGGALHFCGAQARARRVFEITGLIGALPLFNTRDEAVAAFAASGENNGKLAESKLAESKPDSSEVTAAKAPPGFKGAPLIAGERQ